MGFTAPAVVGAATASRPAVVSVPLLLLAGGLEGLALGAAQAHVLSAVLPRLDVRRFALLTSLGAVLAYLMGLLPSTFGDHFGGIPVWVLLPAGLAAGSVLLLSIGFAQWLELRRHLPRAGWWISATAAAWLVGLVVFMAIAMPLWSQGQALALVVLIGSGAAVAMAVAVGLCTGLALVRLSPGQGAAATAAATGH